MKKNVFKTLLRTQNNRKLSYSEIKIFYDYYTIVENAIRMRNGLEAISEIIITSLVDVDELIYILKRSYPFLSFSSTLTYLNNNNWDNLYGIKFKVLEGKLIINGIRKNAFIVEQKCTEEFISIISNSYPSEFNKMYPPKYYKDLIPYYAIDSSFWTFINENLFFQNRAFSIDDWYIVHQCPTCKSENWEPVFYVGYLRYVQCQCCGTMICNPRLKYGKLKYVNKNIDIHRYANQVDNELLENVSVIEKTVHDPKKKAKILDVGFGDGHLLAALSKIGYSTNNLYGYEVNSQKIERVAYILQNKYGLHGMETHLYSCKSILNIGQKFDVVILSSVLEHLMDPKEMIDSIRLLLNKNGILIITQLPNIDCSWVHITKGAFKHFSSPTHYTHWGKKSIRYFLTMEGYQNINIGYKVEKKVNLSKMIRFIRPFTINNESYFLSSNFCKPLPDNYLQLLLSNNAEIARLINCTKNPEKTKEIIAQMIYSQSNVKMNSDNPDFVLHPSDYELFISAKV